MRSFKLSARHEVVVFKNRPESTVLCCEVNNRIVGVKGVENKPPLRALIFLFYGSLSLLFRLLSLLHDPSFFKSSFFCFHFGFGFESLDLGFSLCPHNRFLF